MLAFSFVCLLGALSVEALPRRSQLRNQICAPAAFFLAGDSTTAIQSSGGGGWGDGFLTTLHRGTFGINYGHDGATTASFVSGGDWATVLASVSEYKDSYSPFVTIQVCYETVNSRSSF